MIKHTRDVTVAALAQWMLAHQDDTGCREAAETLGEVGAISTLLEMLDGPLTPRCAFEVVAALGSHADASHLPHLYRHRSEFEGIAAVLDAAVENIEESQRKCTCDQCRDALGGQAEPGGSFRTVVSPTGPPLLN